ncbi:uncharacterized protein LOC141601405 [Silene latifolia]|uniref:uncharacterized protein LOC141601405 n=1 Tax=Silene latifolia TaxID=37657 RepID=UPI003D770F42
MIAVMRAISTFTAASGLHMNKMKSNVYGNGLESGLLEKFASTTGLKIGKLPFKYLGVPISAKKLSVLDCNILVERIVDRIRALGAKKLSYAGRLVLIKSVLGTLHSYWARIYIIPSSIMAKIESTCRSFLWKGDAHSHSNALVSWKQVCLPKEQGGLGVCDIRRWNVAAVGKYVWWVMDKKDHLWVKWVHCTYLKSVPWTDYTPSQSSSWAWKRICRVKDILLSGYIQHDWLEKDAPYSISSGYDWLGTEASNVPWYKHIWITDGIPKHQFISWLYVQQRLLTKDRVHRLFQSSDTECVLCGEEDESHDHLFFHCSYSRKCLQQVQDWSKLAIHERQVLSWWWVLKTRIGGIHLFGSDGFGVPYLVGT